MPSLAAVGSPTRILVVGDSLSDSGTFGYKFTVQGAAPTGAGATALWVDRIAASYGQTLCAHYASSDNVNFSTQPGCTNYAVGGGRINHLTAPTQPPICCWWTVAPTTLAI